MTTQTNETNKLEKIRAFIDALKPLGPDSFSIDTMRTIANQHHAIRFDDWTDAPDDMGQYLIRLAPALYG